MAGDLRDWEAAFGASTAHGWTGAPLAGDRLAEALRVAGLGPTAYNQQPLRAVFVVSEAAKARLAPAMGRSNRDKTLAAPATAILCADLEFWRHLPRLWPQADVRGHYEGRAEAARDSARLNATLQAGYLIATLRAMGLGTGPMAGFDRAAVAAAFVVPRPWEVLFLLNIGAADPAAARPRNPRLGLAEIAEIL